MAWGNTGDQCYVQNQYIRLKKNLREGKTRYGASRTQIPFLPSNKNNPHFGWWGKKQDEQKEGTQKNNTIYRISEHRLPAGDAQLPFPKWHMYRFLLLEET